MKLFGNLKLNNEGKYSDGLYQGLTPEIGQAINAGVGLVGGLAGSAIGNGYNTGVGSTMQSLSSVAGMLPGPTGAIASAALNIGGGLVNRAFGLKTDQEALNNATAGTNYLNNFNSNASSFDDVQGPQTQLTIGNVYKGGWFTGGKAAKKNQALINERNAAQAFADNSVINNVNNIADTQMNNMLANYIAFGGPLHTNGADWNNGIININNGGKHGDNPLGGVPISIAEDNTPNLVEEGEVIFNDYVFSNRIRVPKAVRSKYKLRGKKEMTFAEAAKQAQKESEERPNDPISKRGLEDSMMKLMMEQEGIKQKREERKARRYAKGGHLFYDGGDYRQSMWNTTPVSYTEPLVPQPYIVDTIPSPYDIPTITANRTVPMENVLDTFNNTINLNNIPSRSSGISVESPYKEPDLGIGNGGSGSGKVKTTRTSSPLTALRYAPVLGAAIGVANDLFGPKPDYSNADMILNAGYDARDVRYTPIGDYMRYNPLDRLFYSNQLQANAAGSRRALLNNSGMNRGTAAANILASDYNTLGKLGELYRNAEEYNLAQRQAVANFNRDTNKFNAEMDLKAQMANAENNKLRLNAAAQAAAMREAIDARVGASRSANLTNFFNSLGDIGREAFTRNMITSNPALYYSIDNSGNITYKNGYENLSEAEKDEVNRHIEKNRNKKAYGGCLTIKKRRK